MKKTMMLVSIACALSSISAAQTKTQFDPLEQKTVFYSNATSDLPVFIACNESTLNAAITLSAPKGDQPAMRGPAFVLEPTDCITVQSEKLIATASEVREGVSARIVKNNEAIKRANDWLIERRSSLQSEYDAETDPDERARMKILLDEVSSRVDGSTKPVNRPEVISLTLRALGE